MTGVRITVVRHGATELTGRVLNGGGPTAADPGLTDLGLEQLRAGVGGLAERLADGRRTAAAPGDDFGADLGVVRSPARRAQESVTALLSASPQLARRASGVGVRPELSEVDFGRWEGLSIAEISAAEEQAWLAFTRNAEVPAPGGSSVAELVTGISRLIKALHDGPVRDWLWVGHATTVRAAATLALGVPSEAGARLAVAPGGWVSARFWADGGSSLDQLAGG